MTRTPAAPVTPSVLRWVREDAGFSEAELGARIKVDAQRIKRWEAGAERPRLGQLRQIADALRRPVAFFFTPSPPEQAAERPPDFRANQPGVSKQLRRELRTAVDRRQLYLDLAERGSSWSTWREHPPHTPDEARQRLDVSPAAIARTDTGGALRLWIEAVEALGVLVFQMSGIAVEECRGFALYDEVVPCIVLNGSDAAQARSFTLVHELAHLLDHSGALCLLDEDREVEQRCNRFAAELLMPADRVRDVVGGLQPDDRVDAVIRQFRVSLVAAALRLRGLDLADQATVDATIRRAAMLAKVAANRRTTGGPEHHVLKRRNLGERYLRTVLDALDRDAITFADATYYLESTAATVERMERSLVGGRG